MIEIALKIRVIPGGPGRDDKVEIVGPDGMVRFNEYTQSLSDQQKIMLRQVIQWHSEHVERMTARLS